MIKFIVALSLLPILKENTTQNNTFVNAPPGTFKEDEPVK